MEAFFFWLQVSICIARDKSKIRSTSQKYLEIRGPLQDEKQQT